jgi:hypothetical protein
MAYPGRSVWPEGVVQRTAPAPFVANLETGFPPVPRIAQQSAPEQVALSTTSVKVLSRLPHNHVLSPVLLIAAAGGRAKL